MLKNLLLLCLFATSLIAVEETDDPQMVLEPDQTDVYAIPLDEDADEQQQELNSLEHSNRK